jgi:hypothetical protein
MVWHIIIFNAYSVGSKKRQSAMVVFLVVELIFRFCCISVELMKLVEVDQWFLAYQS